MHRNVALTVLLNPECMELQATVEEALWVSCRLRFTNDVNDLTAKAFVSEVKLSLKHRLSMTLLTPHLSLLQLTMMPISDVAESMEGRLFQRVSQVRNNSKLSFSLLKMHSRKMQQR